MHIRTLTLNPAFDLHYRMESLRVGHENYAQSVTRDAGGKGINTARALTVNGVKCTAFAVLGRDNAAEFDQMLCADRLPYRAVYVPGAIRENMTIHPASGPETRISLDQFSVPPDTLNQLRTRLRPAADDCALAVGGRIPRGLTADCVIEFLTELTRLGTRLVLDSNSMTADDLRRVHPMLIKPNESELAALCRDLDADPGNPAECVVRMAREGLAEQVLVTLGADGAWYSDGARLLHVAAPEICPASTIGAGDSVIAGFLAAWTLSAPIEEALRTAISWGTAACLTPGTLPPIPAQIQALRPHIRVAEYPASR